jgi:hypothetical protein
MLKHLAILAVLAIIAPATADPTEGQAALPGTPIQAITRIDDGQDGKRLSQVSNSDPKSPNLTSADVEMERASCDEACQQGRRNLEIQGKLEWFTRLLVVVGFLQAITMVWQAGLLQGSLKQIRTQAEHMERQNRNAVNSERAKLVVGIAPEELPVADMAWRVTFLIDNIGRSHAFNVWAWASFEFSQSFLPPLFLN